MESGTVAEGQTINVRLDASSSVPDLDLGLLSGLESKLLERGRALLTAAAVVEVRRGRLDDVLILAGRVADGDSAEHRPYVTLAGDRLSSDCSCARKRDCEHVAALLLAALEGNAQPAAKTAAVPLAAAEQHLAYLLRLSPSGEAIAVCPVRVSGVGGQRVTTPFALARLEDSHQPDYIGEPDLVILHQLAAHSEPGEDPAWHHLHPSAHELLAAMIERGHCHWQQVESCALRMGEPLPARADWQLLQTGEQRLRLVATAEPDAVELPLAPPWRINTRTGQCRRLTMDIEDGLLAQCFAAGPLAPEAVVGMRARLTPAPTDFPRPRELVVHSAGSVPARPRLYLVNASGQSEPVPAARLVFVYDEAEFDWHSEDNSRLLHRDDPDRICVLRVQRDSDFEQSCRAVLEQAGLLPIRPTARHSLEDQGLWVARSGADLHETWLSFQASLNELRESGWEVELAEGLVLELIEPERWYGDLHQQARSGDDFELDLGVEYRGERLSVLPALVRWLENEASESSLRLLLSAERPQGWIHLALDQRRVLRMPLERLAATLRGLVDCLDAPPKLTDARLRLPRARLAELVAAAGPWQFGGDQALADLSERLAEFERIDPVTAPEGLHADLRGFQSEGLAWLQFLREFGFGGILADDMGLGKTLQTLAHIQTEKQAGRLDRPCLVLCPTSLVSNWRSEARRFAPGLKVLLLHGPERQGLYQWIDDSDLVITSYALLGRDIDRLRAMDFYLLVLDEAQAIKNPGAQVSRQVRELRARHRLCLSGTPLENHLGEAWSLFDFLMPGLLGSRARFRRLFQLPIERHDDELRRDLLIRRIRPFFLRRTKDEVAPELPPKTEIIRAVALEDEQARLYERVRVALHDKLHRALESAGAERSRILVLDALLKLRQICCDPRLLKDFDGAPVSESAKLGLLMEMLPELIAEGRRVLVFSQFVGMLDLIEAEVRKLGIAYTRLTGRTRNRQKVIDLFQTGQVPLFLISLKAGGVGLNLTAADTVIHYDPWWNPAVEDQATDRAHRIGQDQKVFVYKLLCEGTIEDRVLELQQSKRELIEALFGGGGAAALSIDDLTSLLEPLNG